MGGLEPLSPYGVDIANLAPNMQYRVPSAIFDTFDSEKGRENAKTIYNCDHGGDFRHLSPCRRLQRKTTRHLLSRPKEGRCDLPSQRHDHSLRHPGLG